MSFKKIALSSLMAAVLPMIAATSAIADDVEIGVVEQNGMEIIAVYIQPVTMEPMLPGGMQLSDIHLEADIRALKDNKNGFAEGDWVPYLGITYTINKVDSDWSTTGAFMPMIASDGPHYARNIKLDGAGKYTLTYSIEPPPFNGFYRHTDKESGVAKWWTPFTLEWDFTYVGVGKKGGY
jgi:periplasmic iron binding protein